MGGVDSSVTMPPVVRALLIVTGIGWALLELRQAAKNRSDARRSDRGSRVVIRVACSIGVVGSVLAKRAAPGADIDATTTAAWVGLGIPWSGIGLRLWRFSTLGASFTFTVQTSSDQPVITAGPYGVIGHPSYAGVLLAIIGLGLLIGNRWSLIVLTLALACGVVYRIRVEEDALFEDLGDPYRDYAANHKRLFPFIW